MSTQAVKEYLDQFGRGGDILTFEATTATVELAAQAVGVEPARIAKTLSLQGKESPLIIVMAGDAKLYNGAYKAQFGLKAKMLTPEEALEKTGHAVGGVCPFALPEGIPVYLDVSLQRFSTVFPACGSSHNAIELTPQELFDYSRAAGWVDVCKGWREED